MNVWLVPDAIVESAGVIVTDVSAAGPTVIVGVDAVGTPANAAEITTDPGITAVANPALVPVAIIVASPLLELHVTVDVTSCVVLSVNVPVARNCCFVPTGQLVMLVGLIAIALSVAAVTFTSEFPLTAPSVAVIVAVPTAVPVTIPWLPGVLLTVAFPEFDDQETCVLKSCVLLFEYTPVAYSCRDVPFASVGVTAVVDPCVPVITIVCNVRPASVTVRLNGAEVIPFDAAVMLVVVGVCGSTAVAIPPAPIVAAARLLELQVAVPVMSPVVPSLYVPIAVNCSVPGYVRLADGAEIAIDVSAAGPTPIVPWPVTVVPETRPVTNVLPTPTPVATPFIATVAMPGVVVVHVVLAVTSPVVPFLYVPMACSCSVVPFGIEAFGTLIATDTRLFSTPAPVRLTTCGLPTAPSEIVKVPGIVPATAGVNTNVTVQLEDAFKVAPQVVAVTA